MTFCSFIVILLLLYYFKLEENQIEENHTLNAYMLKLR